ncbi:MAG: hypothetical protein AB1746_14715 [Candidatus Zixiibacteriota bacterium]
MPYAQTEFLDVSGAVIYSDPNLLTIPLYIGMRIDFGVKGTYKITAWSYHPGVENAAALRIICEYMAGN